MGAEFNLPVRADRHERSLCESIWRNGTARSCAVLLAMLTSFLGILAESTQSRHDCHLHHPWYRGELRRKHLSRIHRWQKLVHW
jgi:hypothetical protein